MTQEMTNDKFGSPPAEICHSVIYRRLFGRTLGEFAWLTHANCETLRKFVTPIAKICEIYQDRW